MRIKKLDLTQWLLIIASAIIVVFGFLKGESAIATGIFGGIIIGVLVFLDIKASVIGNIDKDNPKVKAMKFTNRVTMVIVIAMTVIMIYFPKGIEVNESNSVLVVGITSLVMMVLGNKMPQLPMNRNIGFRLPWIVRNEEVWNKTHRLMGILAFPFAIIQFILVFFLTAETAIFVGIVGWIIIGTIYSLYVYYKQFH